LFTDLSNVPQSTKGVTKTTKQLGSVAITAKQPIHASQGRVLAPGNVALGGAWHAQEMARQRSLKIAADAGEEALIQKTENDRLVAENASLRSMANLCLARQMEAAQTNIDLHDAIRKSQALTADLKAALVSEVDTRKVVDQLCSELEQKRTVLEVTLATVERREQSIRSKLDGEMIESSTLRDMLYQEKKKNEQAAVLAARRNDDIRVLKHVQEQKERQISILTKEKNRIQDIARRLQEQDLTRRQRKSGGLTASDQRDSLAAQTPTKTVRTPHSPVIDLRLSPVAESFQEEALDGLARAALVAHLRKARLLIQTLSKDRAEAIEESRRAVSRNQELMVHLRNLRKPSFSADSP
jgi:hypothetical protein